MGVGRPARRSCNEEKLRSRTTIPRELQPEAVRLRALKMILAGAFLLSCLWTAGRVAGSIVVVQGESMLPNFHPNDCALAKPPPAKLERGDVVVLDDGQPECAIKRVVGLPGETIHLWQGQVFINRRLVHEPYLDRNTCT